MNTQIDRVMVELSLGAMFASIFSIKKLDSQQIEIEVLNHNI